ncbi:MAG: hypothetical protein WC551_09165 [Patescibacteria group bacterium]
MAGGIMRFEEETEQMREGFLLWVKQGKGRTYRKVAASLKVDEATVGFWAKFFHWNDRLKGMEDAANIINTNRALVSAAPVAEDESQGKLKQVADQLAPLVHKGIENLQLAVDAGRVLNVGDLVKLVKEHRETLVAYRRGGVSPGTTPTRIDNLTVVLNSMTQEDRIALFTRQTEIADVPGGDQPATAGCAEADYDEVPDGGAEDTGRCEGVSGGVGGGEGGVEGELPPRGSRISILRFEPGTP